MSTKYIFVAQFTLVIIFISVLIVLYSKIKKKQNRKPKQDNSTNQKVSSSKISKIIANISGIGGILAFGILLYDFLLDINAIKYEYTLIFTYSVENFDYETNVNAIKNRLNSFDCIVVEECYSDNVFAYLCQCIDRPPEYLLKSVDNITDEDLTEYKKDVFSNNIVSTDAINMQIYYDYHPYREFKRTHSTRPNWPAETTSPNTPDDNKNPPIDNQTKTPNISLENTKPESFSSGITSSPKTNAKSKNSTTITVTPSPQFNTSNNELEETQNAQNNNSNLNSASPQPQPIPSNPPTPPKIDDYNEPFYPPSLE